MDAGRLKVPKQMCFDVYSIPISVCDYRPAVIHTEKYNLLLKKCFSIQATQTLETEKTAKSLYFWGSQISCLKIKWLDWTNPSLLFLLTDSH